MEPQSVMISEQKALMRMLCLDVTYDEVLAAADSCVDQTINAIEIISATAVLDGLKIWQPQENDWVEEANLYNLPRGIIRGYFRDISVDTGVIRVISY